jgi:hypothetical protein
MNFYISCNVFDINVKNKIFLVKPDNDKIQIIEANEDGIKNLSNLSKNITNIESSSNIEFINELKNKKFIVDKKDVVDTCVIKIVYDKCFDWIKMTRSVWQILEKYKKISFYFEHFDSEYSCEDIIYFAKWLRSCKLHELFSGVDLSIIIITNNINALNYNLFYLLGFNIHLFFVVQDKLLNDNQTEFKIKKILLEGYPLKLVYKTNRNEICSRDFGEKLLLLTSLNRYSGIDLKYDFNDIESENDVNHLFNVFSKIFTKEGLWLDRISPYTFFNLDKSKYFLSIYRFMNSHHYIYNDEFICIDNEIGFNKIVNKYKYLIFNNEIKEYLYTNEVQDINRIELINLFMKKLFILMIESHVDQNESIKNLHHKKYRIMSNNNKYYLIESGVQNA